MKPLRRVISSSILENPLLVDDKTLSG